MKMGIIEFGDGQPIIDQDLVNLNLKYEDLLMQVH